MLHLLTLTISVLAASGSQASLGAPAAVVNKATRDVAETWPNWRGPDTNGVARSERAPTVWSEDKNIRWKVAVPGLGSSTPIVWGDTLYVTSAIEAEGAEPNGVQEFTVFALDRKDGSTKWRTKVAETVPHESIHKTNTQASSSPITDGEHIIAFFGSRGLHCLDMQGKVLWSKDLGRMQTRNQFGEGASPALYRDTIVVVWDHEGEDFIAAFDKATGKEKWRQKRDEVTTWSTPLIVPVGDRMQVVTTATAASRAYDLETGKLIWSIGGMTTNCIPTPIYHEGVVYLMSGFRGAMLQAIRLADAKGDLADSPAVLWRHSQETSYVPSGVLTGGNLYFVRNNNGVLSCVDAATGEVRYSGQRLTDVKSVYSSLTSCGDHIYAPSREGTTVVFAAGPSYREVAVNALDDTFDASPVIVGGELYLRGWKHLYCIADAEQ
ncbi:MAG: PQQ-binding-like beta-propeller repeat protein [Planctomycetota bacterium]